MTAPNGRIWSPWRCWAPIAAGARRPAGLVGRAPARPGRGTDPRRARPGRPASGRRPGRVGAAERSVGSRRAAGRPGAGSARGPAGADATRWRAGRPRRSTTCWPCWTTRRFASLPSTGPPWPPWPPPTRGWIGRCSRRRSAYAGCGLSVTTRNGPDWPPRFATGGPGRRRERARRGAADRAAAAARRAGVRRGAGRAGGGRRPAAAAALAAVAVGGGHLPAGRHAGRRHRDHPEVRRPAAADRGRGGHPGHRPGAAAARRARHREDVGVGAPGRGDLRRLHPAGAGHGRHRRGGHPLRLELRPAAGRGPEPAGPGALARC